MFKTREELLSHMASLGMTETSFGRYFRPSGWISRGDLMFRHGSANFRIMQHDSGFWFMSLTEDEYLPEEELAD